MLQKLYCIMRHLMKVLQLNCSPHVARWVSALGCSSCDLLFFTVCMLATADSAETNLGSVCKFFSSDEVNTSVIKFPWCSSMLISMTSFIMCAVSLLWEYEVSSRLWKVPSWTGVSPAVPCTDSSGACSSSVVDVAAFSYKELKL